MGYKKKIYWKWICDICGYEIDLISEPKPSWDAMRIVKFDYIGNKKYVCSECAEKIKRKELR